MAIEVIARGGTHVFPAQLTVIHCGKCGGIYAINERYRRMKEEVGKGWNCPYCQCSWGYFSETAVQKLEREKTLLLARLDQERARTAEERRKRDKALRQASAARGVVTRTRNRLANGVCPCCNRYFRDLHAHMTAKHRDYLKNS